MDGPDSDGPKKSTGDMTVFVRSSNMVQNLLQQMQSRFQQMSESIVLKIDDMGSRIKELELSINELRTEMGAEGSPSTLTTNKSIPEESKSGDGA